MELKLLLVLPHLRILRQVADFNVEVWQRLVLQMYREHLCFCQQELLIIPVLAQLIFQKLHVGVPHVVGVIDKESEGRKNAGGDG